jgi:cation:H+ antiporter
MLSIVAVIGGLGLLVWSAGIFITGASASAKHLGMPPLLIGLIIVGFGTSAPELFVSFMAALDGAPGIALGNAYGSNIANIALILGITALIAPVTVRSAILRKELPILVFVTLVSGYQIFDGVITRIEAGILFALLAGVLTWSVRTSKNTKSDALSSEMEQELQTEKRSLGSALFFVFVGLTVLILSSRLLVWGAVDIAKDFGISDLMIGLTIVAVGTSLPELASSIIAARRNEHDLAVGNIIGSNIFNVLAVVGLAALTRPISVTSDVFSRDFLWMIVLTLALFVMGYGFRKKNGRINRIEGALLVGSYVAYLVFLASILTAQS